jgi:hypothetical protein
LVARRAHNPKVVGSSPASATKKALERKRSGAFCFFRLSSGILHTKTTKPSPRIFYHKAPLAHDFAMYRSSAPAVPAKATYKTRFQNNSVYDTKWIPFDRTSPARAYPAPASKMNLIYPLNLSLFTSAGVLKHALSDLIRFRLGIRNKWLLAGTTLLDIFPPG